MRGSLDLGRLRGIRVHMHWTFLILLGWIVAVAIAEGRSFFATSVGVLFVLALFGCVVLHELAHALTARRFGIATRDIILLPIGGVSRLERMPTEPKQEFLVAVAGPVASVGIAAVLYVVLVALGERSAIYDTDPADGSLLARLMWTNIGLAIFNMLPAFPMDGGRVLRSALARKMSYVRATQIAAATGQILAVTLGFFGLFGNPFLLFIALFVFLGAQQEAFLVHLRSFLVDMKVKEAMISTFRTLRGDDPLDRATQVLLAELQQDFPVVDGDKVIGILTRKDLIRALADGRRGERVSAIMRRECPVAQPGESLEKAWEVMREKDCPALPVVRDGRPVGLLTLDSITELVMVEGALRGSRSGIVKSEIEHAT